VILEHINHLNMTQFFYLVYVFLCGTVPEFPKYKTDDWICCPPHPPLSPHLSSSSSVLKNSFYSNLHVFVGNNL